MTLDELTSYLHTRIPLTAHLGARVESYDAGEVRLAAPLAPNLNHRGTAFGGSLSTLAILSGWVLVHMQLRDRGIPAEVVIQRASVDFDTPVDGDFSATATLPAPAAWDRFLATLRRHRQARVVVASTLRCASGLAARHEGTFVATRA